MPLVWFGLGTISFAIAILAAGGFLFYAGGETLDAAIALIPVAVAGLPALLRVLGDVQGGGRATSVGYE